MFLFGASRVKEGGVEESSEKEEWRQFTGGFEWEHCNVRKVMIYATLLRVLDLVQKQNELTVLDTGR